MRMGDHIRVDNTTLTLIFGPYSGLSLLTLLGLRRLGCYFSLLLLIQTITTTKKKNNKHIYIYIVVGCGIS